MTVDAYGGMVKCGRSPRWCLADWARRVRGRGGNLPQAVDCYPSLLRCRAQRKNAHLLSSPGCAQAWKCAVSQGPTAARQRVLNFYNRLGG